MTAQGSTKVPPDGGWGWMIVIAGAINGMATVPIMQGFGLIFKDVFPRLGFNATDAAVIINMNLAVGMLLGLVIGPLLRNFGVRKVAVGAAILYIIGVAMTAFANTFTLIMISYGIFGSLGMGICGPTFSYAISSYFTTKRGRAMGLTMTITGLGPIIVPQVTSYFLANYGVTGTILLYAGIGMQSLVGAALLQPLKWHLKEVVNETENLEGNATQQQKTSDEQNSIAGDEESLGNSILDLNRSQRKRKTTIGSIHHDSGVANIYGFDTPLPRQLSETLRAPSWDKNIDTCKAAGHIEFFRSNSTSQAKPNYSWWGSVKSISTINLGSSIKLFEGQSLNHKSQDFQQTLENDALLQKPIAETTLNLDTNLQEQCEKKSVVYRIFDGVNKFFDLDLLRDPIYVNIMLGMSIAIFAEINFSVLTPFILSDIGLSTKEIATVMSVIGGVDLGFRGIAPYVGEWLRQPPRTMYLLSLCLLIISRSFLVLIDGLTTAIFVAVGLGAAKGIRSVFMTLVVPSYVPIERLPYASGIQMVTNGIIVMAAGPILGVIRDFAGSYNPCIIMMNCVTALTVTMWLTEMYIMRRKNLRKETR